MISPFEATLLGVLYSRPGSRYDVMKVIQNQSLYWAGSPGAVYSALARLADKGMVEKVELGEPTIYRTTHSGFGAFQGFVRTPVQAEKLVMEPALLRLKLRGLVFLSPEDRVEFYQAQLQELENAVEMVEMRRGLNSKLQISQDLSDLAIAQLALESDLIKKLLAQDLGELS
ncbi:MAG: PadR family transcriptional regulator [Firmicutes bacterium]|nr:PadR family transcriptional regulator [Bacillota bacterium]